MRKTKQRQAVIKDQDAEFHATDSHPTWAETNFFGFFNAEHKLNVGVYVMGLGQIVGLKAGTGQVERAQERYPEKLQLQMTDAKKRVWRLCGRALTTFPWQCWPNMVSFNSLSEWEMNGLKGHGEVQDFFELPQLNALNSDGATRRPSRPL